MEYMLFVLDLIGTAAFALSGAMTAVRKQMDILGVMILGMVTAVGGGMIRDLILGITPPQAFREPVFAMVSLVISALIFAVLFFHVVRRYRDGSGSEKLVAGPSFWEQEISGERFQQILMAADTLGLAVFTVAGVRAAYDSRMEFGYFLPVFLGTITGVGGGLLRDMMAGDRPYIFVKHVYASASIAGAVLCCLMWESAGEQWAMLTGALAVIVMRFLAIHFKWNLPRIKGF